MSLVTLIVIVLSIYFAVIAGLALLWCGLALFCANTNGVEKYASKELDNVTVLMVSYEGVYFENL